MQLSEAFYKVNPLTQEQRDAAYASASLRIAGAKPQQADYERSDFAKYSAKTVQLINWTMNVVMLAAFIPSAVRIFAAAFDASLAFADAPFAGIIGVCSVLLAEAGQVAFTMSMSIADSQTQRLALRIASWGCTAFALVGNAHIAEPWKHAYAFSWLEAFLPPALVLIAANVRKTQALHLDAERFSAHQRFQEALSLWQQRFDNAHDHAAWERELANALRDALRSANKSSKAVLRELTLSDWHSLILRERNAEEWWLQAERNAREAEEHRLREAQERLTQKSGHTNGNATREIADAATTQEGSVFVKHCPICDKRFEGRSPRAATNAVVAHQKSHKGEERAAIRKQLPIAEVEHIASVNGQGTL